VRVIPISKYTPITILRRYISKQRSLAGCVREKKTPRKYLQRLWNFLFHCRFSLFCVYGYHEDTLTILLLHITNQHFTQCTSVYLLTSYRLDYLLQILKMKVTQSSKQLEFAYWYFRDSETALSHVLITIPDGRINCR